MNTSTDARQQILDNLRDDKKYREEFVAERIASRLPLRIRALRGDRTQKQIAEIANKAQTWISKLEDPNYGKFTLSTLLDVAAVYDVGLEVDFVPFSYLLNEITRVTPETFSPVTDFAEEDRAGAFKDGFARAQIITNFSEGTGMLPPEPQPQPQIQQQRFGPQSVGLTPFPTGTNKAGKK